MQNLIDEIDTCARAVREQAAADALRTIGEAMDRLIGSRMFTFLRFDLERYPVGARKAMRRGPWYEAVGERGEVFIANGDAEMRATFGDYAALAEMGCTASMNVPVRFEGRTLGTMNLNGDEGRYGEREGALALTFATLAVPAYLKMK